MTTGNGRGSVIARGKGRWLLKYDLPRGEDGKRRQAYKTVNAAGKKDAQAALNEILDQRNKGLAPAPSRLTLSDWIAEWLRDHVAETSATVTRERYAELLRIHVEPRIGSMRLQKLTSAAIQGVYTSLRDEGRIGGRSRLHVHRALSRCLNVAVRLGRIAVNPAKAVTAPKIDSSRGSGRADDEDAGHLRVLDRQELQKLLAGFDGTTLGPIVRLGAATGARRSEILALRWRDVDLDGQRLSISRALDTSKSGKRLTKAPKNKSSNRTINIGPSVVGMLRGLRASAVETALKLGVGSDIRNWLVFPASPDAPEVPRMPRAFTNQFRARAGKLGFPGFTFHCLRHTNATLLLLEGLPLLAVSQRLGHASPTITLQVYGHMLPRAEAQAAAMVEGFMAQSVEGIANETGAPVLVAPINRE